MRDGEDRGAEEMSARLGMGPWLDEWFSDGGDLATQGTLSSIWRPFGLSLLEEGLLLALSG